MFRKEQDAPVWPPAAGAGGGAQQPGEEAAQEEERQPLPLPWPGAPPLPLLLPLPVQWGVQPPRLQLGVQLLPGLPSGLLPLLTLPGVLVLLTASLSPADIGAESGPALGPPRGVWGEARWEEEVQEPSPGQRPGTFVEAAAQQPAAPQEEGAQEEGEEEEEAPAGREEEGQGPRGQPGRRVRAHSFSFRVVQGPRRFLLQSQLGCWRRVFRFCQRSTWFSSWFRARWSRMVPALLSQSS